MEEKKRLFRYLRPDEVEVRKGNFIGKDQSKVELLLYKTARVDYALLDETFGPFNWCVQYKTENGILFAGVGIKDPTSGAYIFKWNAGAEQNFEREKSQASDAVKRAGFAWSLGVELYSAPRIVVANENKAYKVTELGCEDGKIKDLVITDKFDNVIYSYHNFKQDSSVPEKAPETPVEEPKPLFDTRPWNVRLQEFCAEMKGDNDDPEYQQFLLAFYYYYLPQDKKGRAYGPKKCFGFFNDDVRNGLLEVDYTNPRHPVTKKAKK